jgi:DNA-binding response OmpR family regulator
MVASVYDKQQGKRVVAPVKSYHFAKRWDSIKEGGMTQQTGLSQERDQLRILVVDDEADTRLLLKLHLQGAGYRVAEAGSGQAALALVQQTGLPQLALLNLLMPEMDGFAVAEALQRLGDVPIIFLSALSDTNTKVNALNRYAEDYMTKPFEFAELLARIRRVLRRTVTMQAVAAEVVIDEQLRINFAQHSLLVNQQQIPLTPLEMQLLRLFYLHRGRVLSPAFLLAHAWPSQPTITKQALWPQIQRLRKKLEPDPEHPRYLVTVRGQGYYLLSPD